MSATLPVAEELQWSLLQATWQSLIIALVVAAVCRIAGSHISASWRFALWGVVFARLACPIAPASLFSAFNLLPDPLVALRDNTDRPTEEGSSLLAVEREERDISTTPTALAPDDSSILPTRSASNQVAVQHDAKVLPASQPAQTGIAGSDIFIFVWGVGAAVLLTHRVRAWICLQRAAATWTVVSAPEHRRLLAECCRLSGVRRHVSWLIADTPVGPATFGLVRPRIVLPASLLTSLGPEQLRMLLLHELSHIRRADVLWDRLAGILLALHWFNPVAWWTLRRLRDEREQACDAEVMHITGRNCAATYGRLILHVADRQRPINWHAAVIGVFGRSYSLKRRIEMISQFRQRTWWNSLLGFAVLVAISLCGLTNAQTQVPSANSGSAATPGYAQHPAARRQNDDGKYVVSGVCHDAHDQGLAGVRVRAFRVDGERLTRELIAETTSDASGGFEFADLPAPVAAASDPNFLQTYYVLAATRPGHASQLRVFSNVEESTEGLELKMPSAASLTGRVTDSDGHPIEGAEVYVHSYPSRNAIDGAFSATTDADGRYEIADLLPWDAEAVEPTPVGDGTLALDSLVACYFTVLHPDYAMTRPMYNKVPGTVDIVLEPAGTIEGRVVDDVTGTVGAGVMVAMQGVHPTNGWHQTITDEMGRYQLTSVEAGQYNVWAHAEERTCVAIDTLEVATGETCSDKDFVLIEGSWIEGRVLDAVTGQPFKQAGNPPLRVAIHGPSRPKSGAAVTSAPVDADGRFGIRVAPGKNFPYIMTYEVWSRTEHYERYGDGIDVRDGELVAIEFRVLPEVPRKPPEFSPVRLSVPVAEERSAAATVRRLGGWYAVDDERHVVEVNMAYHKTDDGVRYDNDQSDTDEVLQAVPSFPRLQRLFVKEGQATDESMPFVAALQNLEILIVWDAGKISDAGVRHLEGLQNLREIHIDNSDITDNAMKVFATLPHLEKLSLQGNQFSNAALEYLSDSTNLHSLVIGGGDNTVNDEGLVHLKRLTKLNRLGLQDSQITDAGLRHLSGLSDLKALWVGSTNVTERGIEQLQQELPKLESALR